MVKSMTGFGCWVKETEDYKITVEIKSVNHRYCDLSVKLPRIFQAFESRIRNILKEFVSRGKVDVYIGYEDFGGGGCRVQYHPGLAREYVEAVASAGEEFHLESGLTGASLVRFPEVVTLSQESRDIDALFPDLEAVVRQAAQRFVDARESEGSNLQRDILMKLDYIEELVDRVESRSPETLREYRDRIYRKVEEFLGDRKVDESVLATELIVYADKVCVDEETVRLRSHVDNMRKTMGEEGAVGRKLDFVAQEMNREANTILSKANDRELSGYAIDLKTEIEKIREQIQNIE